MMDGTTLLGDCRVLDLTDEKGQLCGKVLGKDYSVPFDPNITLVDFSKEPAKTIA